MLGAIVCAVGMYTVIYNHKEGRSFDYEPISEGTVTAPSKYYLAWHYVKFYIIANVICVGDQIVDNLFIKDLNNYLDLCEHQRITLFAQSQHQCEKEKINPYIVTRQELKAPNFVEILNKEVYEKQYAED